MLQYFQNKLNNSTHKEPYVKEALKFLNNRCCQYVYETGRVINKTFPIVKAPESFSSIAVFYAARYNRTVEAHWLIFQSYFANQMLSAFLQDLNEMAMRYLWTQLIRTTKNQSKSRPTNHEVGTFHREIYANQRRDRHPFLDRNSTNFQFPSAIMDGMAISLDDIIVYINLVRDDIPNVKELKTGKKDFLMIHPEWKKFHPAFDDKGDMLYDYDNKGERDTSKNPGMLANLESRILNYEWREKYGTTTLQSAA